MTIVMFLVMMFFLILIIRSINESKSNKNRLSENTVNNAFHIKSSTSSKEEDEVKIKSKNTERENVEHSELTNLKNSNYHEMTNKSEKIDTDLFQTVDLREDDFKIELKVECKLESEDNNNLDYHLKYEEEVARLIEIKDTLSSEYISNLSISSADKIKLVRIKPMPIEKDSFITTNSFAKTYTLLVYPQKKDCFEFDKTITNQIKCSARSMRDALDYTCLVLCGSSGYYSDDTRSTTCGHWYEGDCYSVQIESFEKYQKEHIEGKIIIDAEAISKENSEKYKKEAAERRKELKNTPKKIIPYKEVILEDSEKKPADLPPELHLPDTIIQDRILHVLSGSMPGFHYEINLKDMTCSCERFSNQKRIRFKKNDVRRVCRHMFEAVSRLRSQKHNYSDITSCILNSGSFDENLEVCTLSSGATYYIGHRENKEWANVYTRKRIKEDRGDLCTGAYSQFTYNKKEKRWSYGSSPYGASQIKQNEILLN